jgi:hypothetical protein
VRAMRLLIKFNLILIIVFGSGMAVAGYFARDFMQQIAHEQVLQQARLMMGSAGVVRTYTTKQVGPLPRSTRNGSTLSWPRRSPPTRPPRPSAICTTTIPITPTKRPR